MSNFAKNLVKGFVRSAVNQVGRDGGRVISNEIYHGRNYVPIARVNQQPITETHITIQGKPDEFAGAQPQASNDVQSATTNLKPGKLALLIFASIFIPLLGGLAAIIYGIVEYFNTNDKLYWYENEPQYVTDRRYKEGYRYVNTVRVKHTATVKASPEALAIHKKNGTVAMLIGAVGIAINIIVQFVNISPK